MLLSVLAPVAALVAPAPAPALPAAAAILHTTERVADWQLAHLDTTAHMPAATTSALNPRDWQQATFWVGMAALANRAPRYRAAILKVGAAQHWRLGDRPFHADDQLIGAPWLWASRHGGGDAALAPMKRYYANLLAHRSTSALTFTDNPNGHGNPPCTTRWCWCDALFMAPPTLFGLSEATGDPRYAAFADQEFRATVDYLYDKQEHLFFRDSRFFDRRDEKGRKLFWSRGNGWVLAGLARVLDTLKPDDPRRDYYRELFRQMAPRVAGLQKADGYWPASLLDSAATQPESSGTALFVFALAKGISLGVIDRATYQPVVARGWSALGRAIQPDGMLGWVQQVGDRPDTAAADASQFYGSGALLLAGSAVYDLLRQDRK
ncbi:MAG: glycoside hydrolase family 88/105 protein [Sphingomonas sp.]